MIALRVAVTVGLALLASSSVSEAINTPELFPGTYSQIDTVTRKVLSVGNVIVLARSKSGKLGFSIDAIRALDSNQGFIAGTFQPGTNVVWVQKIPDADCKLTFAAIPHGIIVVQDAKFGDCGFGHGVDASGTYRWMGELGSKT